MCPYLTSVCSAYAICDGSRPSLAAISFFDGCAGLRDRMHFKHRSDADPSAIFNGFLIIESPDRRQAQSDLSGTERSRYVAKVVPVVGTFSYYFSPFTSVAAVPIAAVLVSARTRAIRAGLWSPCHWFRLHYMVCSVCGYGFFPVK